ncbi:MAG: hypothetical protein JW892_17540 [Anaerolineae bacterium]|nr:hypothetical protein [Anaerolineae bacterium]
MNWLLFLVGFSIGGLLSAYTAILVAANRWIKREFELKAAINRLLANPTSDTAAKAARSLLLSSWR